MVVSLVVLEARYVLPAKYRLVLMLSGQLVKNLNAYDLIALLVLLKSRDLVFDSLMYSIIQK